LRHKEKTRECVSEKTTSDMTTAADPAIPVGIIGMINKDRDVAVVMLYRQGCLFLLSTG
jgi:hypothetical protein